MNRIIVPLMVLCLLIVPGAGQQAQDDPEAGQRILQLGVDGERTIAPAFTNHVSAPDNITVTLQGTAVANGLVTWDVTESSGITCNDAETACNLSMPARSTDQLFLTLEGAMVGQGDLVIKGTSRRTRLSNTDTIEISTLPRTPEGEVKEAPGIMPAQLLALILLGGLATFMLPAGR